MHLLHTQKRKLNYFLKDVPPYAILSHTWEEEEVTFDDIDKPHATDMKGYQKILGSCAQALEDGFGWIWIDTCCKFVGTYSFRPVNANDFHRHRQEK
jgi:hypothetical protein